MRFKVLIFLSLFCFSSLAWAMSQVPEEAKASPLVGRPAPDAVLAQSNGASASVLGARQGKKAVLIFWATWCPNCYQELGQTYNDLAALEQQGIKIILVDVGENKESVQKYFERRQMKWGSFVDQNSVLQDPYHLVGVPTLVFIDQKGLVRSTAHVFPSDYQKYFSRW